MLAITSRQVPYARNLIRLYNTVTVCVEFRLAPEHPFPARAQDAHEALKWCAHDAAWIGVDRGQRFIVSSRLCWYAPLITSNIELPPESGGRLAKAGEKGLTPKLGGQWLSVPVLFS